MATVVGGFSSAVRNGLAIMNVCIVQDRPEVKGEIGRAEVTPRMTRTDEKNSRRGAKARRGVVPGTEYETFPFPAFAKSGAEWYDLEAAAVVCRKELTSMASDLTIHNLDDQLLARLRDEARRQGVPIDQLVAQAIADKLPAAWSLSNGDFKRDLSGLAGVWNDDDAREFFEAIKDLQQVDEELWK